MKIDVNLSVLSDHRLDTVIELITKLGEKMATVKDVFDAVLAQQAIIAQGVGEVTALVVEVKKLIAMGVDPLETQALLDKIAATNQVMTDGFAAIDALTAEVDAANG